MSTRTAGWSRSSRFVIWLTAVASLAALFSALLFSAPAKASHTIRPGWFPEQLSPYYRPLWGIPGADPFVSTRATRCTGQAAGGTYLLLRYLQRWYPRGENWGIYNCRLPSLHSEGRAVDFHLENTDPYDKAHGDQIFYWFLREDYGGTAAAMARRWGVQEIIWNCAIWSVNGGLRTYYRCDPNDPGFSRDRTLRHEDHVHIGQNPYGAGGYTTAYTGYRPCGYGHPGCPF